MDQIKSLEKQLIDAQANKLDKAGLLLELTQENKKLTKENREYSIKCKDLQERLTQVEKELSDKAVEVNEKEDIITGYTSELAVREGQLQAMEDKNKKLTQECQILTVKILEERNKMIEILNEANGIYEDASLKFD